jgi:hypothetical protein
LPNQLNRCEFRKKKKKKRRRRKRKKMTMMIPTIRFLCNTKVGFVILKCVIYNGEHINK